MGVRKKKKIFDTESSLEKTYHNPRKQKVTDLNPKTMSQRVYAEAIRSKPLTFGVGPAGTGKTYVCAMLAAEALANKQTDRIYITRPVIEAGESLGFLPGELDEKFDPFFAPVREVFADYFGEGPLEFFLKSKRIVVSPLAYMRGMTFKNSWVILDEAQNTTKNQMLMFLSRIGENATVIVNGDLAQKDIECKSGLEDAVERLSDLEEVRCIYFDQSDIVRSGLVGKIVKKYME